MTQNLILRLFFFQVKSLNGLEDIASYYFLEYFFRILLKGVFLGFLKYFKTLLKFKYKFKGCHFLVSY